MDQSALLVLCSPARLPATCRKARSSRNGTIALLPILGVGIPADDQRKLITEWPKPLRWFVEKTVYHLVHVHLKLCRVLTTFLSYLDFFMYEFHEFLLIKQRFGLLKEETLVCWSAPFRHKLKVILITLSGKQVNLSGQVRSCVCLFIHV